MTRIPVQFETSDEEQVYHTQSKNDCIRKSLARECKCQCIGIIDKNKVFLLHLSRWAPSHSHLQSS